VSVLGWAAGKALVASNVAIPTATKVGMEQFMKNGTTFNSSLRPRF
jgi:hypothetical protein